MKGEGKMGGEVQGGKGREGEGKEGKVRTKNDMEGDRMKKGERGGGKRDTPVPPPLNTGYVSSGMYTRGPSGRYGWLSTQMTFDR